MSTITVTVFWVVSTVFAGILAVFSLTRGISKILVRLEQLYGGLQPSFDDKMTPRERWAQGVASDIAFGLVMLALVASFGAFLG